MRPSESRPGLTRYETMTCAAGSSGVCHTAVSFAANDGSTNVLGEDLPSENNRVELDPDAKDSNGIPAPRVVYTYNDNSLKMLEHAAGTARQSLESGPASMTGRLQRSRGFQHVNYILRSPGIGAPTATKSLPP